jgi:hypothetical protein
MDKKRKPTKEHNFAVNAFRVVQEATTETTQEKPEPENKTGKEKNPVAVALGRLGGLKGGKARLIKMTSEQRQDIARKAAQKRWNKT